MSAPTGVSSAFDTQMKKGQPMDTATNTVTLTAIARTGRRIPGGREQTRAHNRRSVNEDRGDEQADAIQSFENEHIMRIPGHRTG